MVAGSDDAVVIKPAKKAGEPSVITVSCPDKTGLGCDLCWVILEFGLCILREDVSTDGRWCYFVFWVVPSSDSINVQWNVLKNRLMTACPSCLISYFCDSARRSTTSEVYLLKVLCTDRKGLLHDVTRVLCDLGLLIQRVKVSTTPDGRVLDLFFVTDGMELLHTTKRREEICERLNAVLGDSCDPCEIQLPGIEHEILQQGCSTLPPVIADELFSPEGTNESIAKLQKYSVTVDNSLSPSHTLLQIRCINQKALLYDILRILKDCDIQIAHDRYLSDMMGYRDIDLLVQQSDGKKILDPEKQSSLCARLISEMRHPLRVTIVSRGPDTELLVANPVESSGKGRPRVFYDVTLALKTLDICVFSAEIGRHSTMGRQWEVYRFLLDETGELPLACSRARERIVEGVRKTLMGWN